MGKSKHTPGPWKIERSTQGHRTVIYKPEGKYDPRIHAIAFTVVRDQRSMEEIEANARLIARSPSMLALLEKVLPIVKDEAIRREMAMRRDSDKIDTGGDYWNEMRELAGQIYAEICKAKGEQDD